MKRPASKRAPRSRRIPAPVPRQTEIVTKEVLYDDRHAGGDSGRYVEARATVEGRTVVVQAYDSMPGDEPHRLLSLEVTPYSHNHLSDLSVALTPGQLNALVGVLASVRDKVGRA